MPSFVSPPACRGCGQPVKGAYVEALGAYWHPDHFLCTVCRKPVESAFSVTGDNRPAHQDCWIRAFAPRCKGCAEPIVGRYTTDIWDEASCEGCLAAGRCDYCHGAGKAIAFTPYVRCAACRRLGVTDAGQAQALYDEVIAWLGTKRFFEDLPRPPMQLFTAERMRRDLNAGDNVLGMARRIVIDEGPRKVSVEADQLVIRSGLPAPMFQMVASHELGHIWVAGAQILHITPVEEEGFCELLAYLWLSERGGMGRGRMMRQIEDSPDPVYGEGFRLMRAREEAGGLIALMQGMVSRSQLQRRADVRNKISS